MAIKKPPKPFSGNEGKSINLKSANRLMAAHQTTTAFSASNKIKGGFFGEKILLKILSQPGCVGIRYYHAVNAKGEPTIVLVGAKSNRKAMWDAVIADFGPLCPPWCD